MEPQGDLPAELTRLEALNYLRTVGNRGTKHQARLLLYPEPGHCPTWPTLCTRVRVKCTLGLRRMSITKQQQYTCFQLGIVNGVWHAIAARHGLLHVAHVLVHVFQIILQPLSDTHQTTDGTNRRGASYVHFGCIKLLELALQRFFRLFHQRGLLDGRFQGLDLNVCLLHVEGLLHQRISLTFKSTDDKGYSRLHDHSYSFT